MISFEVSGRLFAGMIWYNVAEGNRKENQKQAEHAKEDVLKAIDNTTIQIILAIIAAFNVFIMSIVNWNKVRPVLCSRFMVSMSELALMCGCFWLGKWGIVAGATVYVLLEFFDFVRRNDNSCAAIGGAMLSVALGVFNFAIQFALAVKGS